MNYDAINFKNKDVDKFATKFGNNEDPITKGMAQRKADQEKKNADRIKAGIDAVVKQSPAQAKAFDKKKDKMAKEYDANHPGEKYITAIGNGVINGAKGAVRVAKETGKFAEENGKRFSKDARKAYGAFKEWGNSQLPK